MKRVMVIGCPGSGKSTFSRKLHKLTGIPLYHLDLMYWNPDRTIVDKSVFRERLVNAIQSKEWIIDGNYKSTLELRLQACDTVVFLDYSVNVCLDGIKKRRGKPRTDMPWIENEEDREFIEFVKNYNCQNRPGVMELLNQYANKDIYIFKERKEANEFLNRLQQQLPVCGNLSAGRGHPALRIVHQRLTGHYGRNLTRQWAAVGHPLCCKNCNFMLPIRESCGIIQVSAGRIHILLHIFAA